MGDETYVDPEQIRERDWFNEDDELHVPDDFDPAWDTVEWSHDEYIASDQLWGAFHDPGIEVGDVNFEEGVVHLKLIEETVYPVLEMAELSSLASTRFGLKHGEHESAEWLDDEPRWHLYKAHDELSDATYCTKRGSTHDAKEHIADAYNHLLFTLDILNET